MKKIIIAVDGFSSCGKSTFARQVAAELGYIFIDTGAMYRAVTLYAMQRGLFGGQDNDAPDRETIVKHLDEIDIRFKYNDSMKASDIFLNGENVENIIRTIEVSDRVSAVSQIPEVRERLVRLQQAMGAEKGIVMDGRDIGTVVFPHAELKIFMTADTEVRARRRYDELVAKGDRVTLDEVRENIKKRDRADLNRTISPLRKAPDAVVLDNSQMRLEDQWPWMREVLKERRLWS
jgi:cytidylate kinase